jgi:hypothetical protein
LAVAQQGAYTAPVFDELISFDPEIGVATPRLLASDEGVRPLELASVQEVADAQRTSADWLAGLGIDDEAQIDADLGRKAARSAFQQLTVGEMPDAQKTALLSIKSPTGVAHLTGMLTAYDWEFVERAKELRGYVVARLLEESAPETGGKAADRLKALVALGKVTEVGLFTEKVEITKKDMSDEELDAKIKDRMDRLRRIADSMPRPLDRAPVTDVEAKKAEAPEHTEEQ